MLQYFVHLRGSRPFCASVVVSALTFVAELQTSLLNTFAHAEIPWLQDSARALKRRYFLMMKAKDAARIGVVVATTSVAGYSEMVERLKTVIRAAGKRAYVFYVGKISPAKLANFAEMDALVMQCAAPPCCMLHARPVSASCPRLSVSD